MNIKFEFFEDSLLIDESLLVIGDLHLGYEEAVLQKDIFIGMQIKEIIKKLNSIFKKIEERGYHLKKIVILGDLKHNFGKILNSEWREGEKLFNYLKTKIQDTNEIIVIKGNHDKILEPILKKNNIQFNNYYFYNSVLFLHGDKEYLTEIKKSKYLILGHLHPSIEITDNYKKEKFKCFLNGKYMKKTVYIIPSFSEASSGFNLKEIDKKEFLFIKNKILEKFEVLIYNNKEDEIYNFGKLKDLI